MGCVSLKWDITGECNLRCGHCLQGDRLREGAAPFSGSGVTTRELDEAQFSVVVDKFPASEIAHINLLGGEPTLLGDKFLGVIRQCAAKGIKTTFNTNGVTLKLSLVKKVIDAGAAGIIVSIDGPTALSHDAVRGKGTFEIITKNVSGLTRYVKEHDIPFETTVSTVVTPYNGNILGKMVDYCNEIGVETLNLLPMSYTGYAANNISDLHLSEEREIEIADNFVQNLSQRSEPIGPLRIEARFVLPPLSNYLEEKYGYGLPLTKNCCSATTTFGYINPAGDLFPCDRVAYDYADVDFGAPGSRVTSLLDFDFYEVWNSGYQTGMFQYVTNRSTYKHYVPCNRCQYLDAGLCVPCPLFRFRTETVSFYQCLYAEKQLGTLQLSKRHRQERTTGSHYLNQYQPRRRFVVANGDNRVCGKRVRRAVGVRWNTTPEGEVVFNPWTNKFYTLNPLGRRIWHLLDNEKTDEEILRELPEEDSSLNGVRDFLDALVGERLIDVVQSTNDVIGEQ